MVKRGERVKMWTDEKIKCGNVKRWKGERSKR
jgi:hypothetical protein